MMVWMADMNNIIKVERMFEFILKGNFTVYRQSLDSQMGLIV